MGQSTRSYKSLTVWQRSMNLVQEVYRVTERLPSDERFGLASQMNRAAVSIPSNIAEGRYRSSKKDYLRFLRQAFSSGAELETQIELCKRLYPTLSFADVDPLICEVMKMLNTMTHNLSNHLTT